MLSKEGAGSEHTGHEDLMPGAAEPLPVEPRRSVHDVGAEDGDVDALLMDGTPPLQPAAVPERLLPSAGGGGSGSLEDGNPPPLSFANPDDEQRLVQQLSAKLVPVAADMLTVSSEGSKSRCASARASGGQPRRSSRSCDPSPRDSVHMRLYNKALDAKKRAQVQGPEWRVHVCAVGCCQRHPPASCITTVL